MTKKILAVLLLAGSTMFAADFSIGINIGAPPPPRIVRVRPVAPGPDYLWIDGYWYPDGGHYRWHAGYWTLPPYPGAHWIGPRHDGRQYFAGYWDGPRGQFGHDHKWDHGHERDRDRFHDDHDRH